jgi:hypothetical protein
MGAFLPPTWDQLVSAQVKIATSCAGVSVLGAAVTVWVAQLTASPASVVNATPPLPNCGSLDERAREDRAKFVQNGPLLLLLKVASWAIPAEDPFGRTIFGQSAFSAIMSPPLPVIGLTASQLYSCVPVAGTVVLKSPASWSVSGVMVSDPTPTASFSPGEGLTVTLTGIVVSLPPWVTLAVTLTVPGLGKTPSIRFVQLFFPPTPEVTGPGSPVVFQVHFVVLGWTIVKAAGTPATTVLPTAAAARPALWLTASAWAVAVRPSVLTVAAVAATTMSLRMLLPFRWGAAVGIQVLDVFRPQRRPQRNSGESGGSAELFRRCIRARHDLAITV